MDDLLREWGLAADSVAVYTSVVQLGFIAGTVAFSLLALADRFSPANLFFLFSILGALCNAGIFLFATGPVLLIVLRLATGFCLAGIYPVGMKIAARWFPDRAGQAIGYLVGALVLGTAFPHLISTSATASDWRVVLGIVSLLAISGGLLVRFGVGDPPATVSGESKNQNPARFRFRDLGSVFAARDLRCAALGYFGHMWELYAFWTFVPATILYLSQGADTGIGALDVSFWSFVVIGAGAIGCVVGGILSRRFGSTRVAFAQLAGSGLLCLSAPFLLVWQPYVALGLLIVWGILVAGDSPQFSALAARTAPPALTGTALTVVTGIGFALTIPSIQLAAYLFERTGPGLALLALAPGPILGLIALAPLLRRSDESGRSL